MTREEAINEVKKVMPTMWKETKEALGILIPELAESEDERIRRALIEFLREAYSSGNAPEECAKWLVWLDCPKEQKILQTKVKQRMEYLWDKLPDSHKVENGDCTPEEWKTLGAYMELEMNFDEDGFNTKQDRQKPEPYFYCKYGGTMPLCSDCQRNHNNSSFKTEEITTWYAPSNGTKHCIDYIQQEQPEMELNDETFIKEFRVIRDKCFNEGIEGWQREKLIARHFFSLGRNARKEE